MSSIHSSEELNACLILNPLFKQLFISMHVKSFSCSFIITALFLGIKPVCAFLVYVSLQTFADMENMGSSVPQLMEEPSGELDRGSPVSNPASTNTVTNPECPSYNTDKQVCPSPTIISFSASQVISNVCHARYCLCITTKSM